MSKIAKFCPLASAEGPSNWWCEGEECAWWDERNKMCIVRRAVELMGEMAALKLLVLTDDLIGAGMIDKAHELVSRMDKLTEKGE